LTRQPVSVASYQKFCCNEAPQCNKPEPPEPADQGQILDQAIPMMTLGPKPRPTIETRHPIVQATVLTPLLRVLVQSVLSKNQLLPLVGDLMERVSSNPPPPAPKYPAASTIQPELR
jgi:hypothetical protein